MYNKSKDINYICYKLDKIEESNENTIYYLKSVNGIFKAANKRDLYKINKNDNYIIEFKDSLIIDYIYIIGYDFELSECIDSNRIAINNIKKQKELTDFDLEILEKWNKAEYYNKKAKIAGMQGRLEIINGLLSYRFNGQLDSFVPKIAECLYPLINSREFSWYRFKGKLSELDLNINGTILSKTFYNTRFRKISLNGNIDRLGKESFKNCYNLEELNLSDTIEEISDEAFMNCGGLKHITLPLNLKYIGECAFYNGNFAEIVIPEHTEIIERNAFGGCDYLRKLIIKSDLKVIKPDSFDTNIIDVTIKRGYCKHVSWPSNFRITIEE